MTWAIGRQRRRLQQRPGVSTVRTASAPPEVPLGVSPDNRTESGPEAPPGGSQSNEQNKEACGASTPAGPCAAPPAEGRTRCRMHGGASTGPNTPEGRQRLSEKTRAQRIAESLAHGWLMPPEWLRNAVVTIKARLHGSQNATARTLGVTRHTVRRVLTGLPLRPEELEHLRGVFGGDP